jgi:hypothetical protein
MPATATNLPAVAIVREAVAWPVASVVAVTGAGEVAIRLAVAAATVAPVAKVMVLPATGLPSAPMTLAVRDAAPFTRTFWPAGLRWILAVCRIVRVRGACGQGWRDGDIPINM